MASTGAIEDLASGELLDHVESLARTQREAEVGLLRAAYQHAVVHDVETVDPEASRLPGREQARRYGGEGTPWVAEFAAAELGARAGLSPHGGRALMADALDLHHRMPQLWARVQALEVRASYARMVARRCRDLPAGQARYVDARVVEYADGRVSWARFEHLVDAAIVAADPEAARAREEAERRRQFAEATATNGHGVRGFYIRGPFQVIARLDASVARIAQVLADLGDTDSLDQRRVKAVLVLAHPGRAAELLAAYAAWRHRPEGPQDPPGRQDPEDPAHPADPGRAGSARTGTKPVVTWSDLLPRVSLYVHCYRGTPGAPGEGVARVEGHGPVTEAWVRDHLGPAAKFTIRPVLDLAGQAPVDAYEVPENHRQAVQLMTPADVFPFANHTGPLTGTTGAGKQVDHTVPYDPHGPPGQSRIGNYGPMTTLHHRIKTFGGWQVQQPFPGIYLWRDPHGATYLVDHTGTRRIDTAGPRAA